ncbi:hypothetical protein KSS87_019996 [Heliosperma pusillum]|nr:hypothetical protein KSS87_019996 [Heliosperma pusillum]
MREYYKETTDESYIPWTSFKGELKDGSIPEHIRSRLRAEFDIFLMTNDMTVYEYYTIFMELAHNVEEMHISQPMMAVLIWHLFTTSWLTSESNKLSDVLDSLLFGVNPWAMRFKMSLADLGYLVAATVISVTVHEFGHVAAAASVHFSSGFLILSIVGISSPGISEGIELEYIAIFLAILFPGALVAFNYELLHSKPRSTALRIYCAGIWHNAVCCAACGLALLLLPLLLSPLFIHGDGPMVVDVSASSPLSGYLSPGDNIVSLEGAKMFSAVDWMEMVNSLEKRSLASSEFKVMKGYPTMNRAYCAPNFLVQNRERLFSVSNHSACPDDHVAFVSTPCFDVRSPSDGTGYCLGSTDAVSLKSCGSVGMSESTCVCSENEMCLSPVLEPGVVWAEITYRSPHNRQCNPSTSDASDYQENCHKSFLYVGDAFSMTRSLRLTSYQPRFAFPFATYLPDMFENILVWTFQISLALALLNSLPVYCLDGESILEVSSLSVTGVSPRKRRLFLQHPAGNTLMNDDLSMYLYK